MGLWGCPSSRNHQSMGAGMGPPKCAPRENLWCPALLCLFSLFYPPFKLLRLWSICPTKGNDFVPTTTHGYMFHIITCSMLFVKIKTSHAMTTVFVMFFISCFLSFDHQLFSHLRKAYGKQLFSPLNAQILCSHRTLGPGIKAMARQQGSCPIWHMYQLTSRSSWRHDVRPVEWLLNHVAQTVHQHLVGGFNPSEKYESQLGWWFPIYGKIKMFQTTNQKHFNIWPIICNM